MLTDRLAVDPRSPADGEIVASPRSWARFLIGFAILYGVLGGLSEFDPRGRWRLLIMAAVVLTAVVVERLLYRDATTSLRSRLGLGRPKLRAVALALAVSVLVLMVYPLYAVVTRSWMPLQPRWGWILLGLFAFHGLAEEIVWRGYAFRHLRAGRTFWRAVWWSMPLIAATHVPIVITMGPVIGLGAMLVAAVTSISFSYLYETGRGTIWAPAIVHTAIDMFKLFVIPASGMTTISLLLILISLTVPLLALVVPRRVLIGHAAMPVPIPEPRPSHQEVAR